MKIILTTIFILILSVSGFAQSEKFLKVSNIILTSNSKDFPNKVGNSSSDFLLDAQQKDILKTGNTEYNTRHLVSIIFDKLSDKPIKSVSYQLILNEGNKTVFKKKLSCDLKVLADEKLLGIALFYTLYDFRFDKKTTKEIKIISLIFEDGTKLKF